jgi:hypothetical protein
MKNVLKALFAFVLSFFKTRSALQLEILALSHQLAVCRRSQRRPALKSADRIFWAWLSKVWSGSIRRECLDHMIILNERHLRRTLRAYLDYYHRSRVHQSLDMDCPVHRPVEHPDIGPVVEISKIGGLHHRYERRAA